MSDTKDNGPVATKQLMILPVAMRDWFAGQAIIGLLSNPEGMGNIHRLAEAAYRIADALMEKRRIQL